jgi:hypothetical protein
MKVAIRTLKRIVLEVSHGEMRERGFDSVWDEIRIEYPESEFELFTIDDMTNDDAVFFELTPRSS